MSPPARPVEASPSGHPFDRLTPDFILDAIDRILANRGQYCDGRILALNSYENRVYQIGIEDGDPLIAKFYRPGRWTDAQIAEEHNFCQELAADDIPVVTPLAFDGQTLLHDDGFRFTLFPRRGGRAPDFDNPDHLLTMGRWLARIHSVGARQPFLYRPTLDLQTYGIDSVQFLVAEMIPASLKTAHETLTRDLLACLAERIATLPLNLLRTHCDCHPGNVLWRDELPHFVDFDDARMAPAIQDIWMLLSGSRQEQIAQLDEIVAGYDEFRDFDRAELAWIEPLRTLRMLHYSAWLGRRWDDPAFPRHFPWFNSERYWGEQILALREQLAALQEPPLRLA